MNRRQREEAILDILEVEGIATQQDLVDALAGRGFEVTQATVSRDIKRMGLLKVPHPDGSYRYHPPEAGTIPPPSARDFLRDTLRSFALKVAPGNALLVMDTQAGTAPTVASALDAAQLPGVVGTVAGDDTILVILESPADCEALQEVIRDLMGA